MSSTVHRLFLALPLTPSAAAQLLQMATSKIPGLDRLTYDPADLHLTVKFIGEVESIKVDEVIAAVAPIISTLAPFKVELKKIQHFPKATSPLIVALAQLSLPLAAIYRDLNILLAQYGVGAESRAFRPHITLSNQAKNIKPIEALFYFTFEASEIALYESNRDKNGIKYQVLHRFSFQ